MKKILLLQLFILIAIIFLDRGIQHNRAVVILENQFNSPDWYGSCPLSNYSIPDFVMECDHKVHKRSLEQLAWLYNDKTFMWRLLNNKLF